MTSALPWRIMLVHELVWLLASWDPDRGLREFSLGTTSVNELNEASIWT